MPFKPSFSGLMLEPIRDASMTGPHFRVLAAVLFHDRFSLPKEKGKGCNAKNVTIAEETDLSYAVVCRCLSDLVTWGYLTRERTGRETIYRGVYTDRKAIKDCPIQKRRKGDNIVTNSAADQTENAAAIGDDSVIRQAEIGDTFDNFGAASVSDEKEIQAQYITLRGEIDSPKEGKEIPSKGRAAPARGLAEWKDEFDRLPNDGARVASIERIWRRNPEWIEQEREAFRSYLFDVHEIYSDENRAVAAHALRLWEEFAPC